MHFSCKHPSTNGMYVRLVYRRRSIAGERGAHNRSTAELQLDLSAGLACQADPSTKENPRGRMELPPSLTRGPPRATTKFVARNPCVGTHMPGPVRKHGPRSPTPLPCQLCLGLVGHCPRLELHEPQSVLVVTDEGNVQTRHHLLLKLHSHRDPSHGEH